MKVFLNHLLSISVCSKMIEFVLLLCIYGTFFFHATSPHDEPNPQLILVGFFDFSGYTANSNPLPGSFLKLI